MQPVSQQASVEAKRVEPSGSDHRPLFGNQLRWAKSVIVEAIEDRRAKQAASR